MFKTNSNIFSVAISVASMVLVGFGYMPGDVVANSSSFTVEIESRFRPGTVGEVLNLGTFGIPSEMQNQACNIDVSTTNNRSIHPNNDLHFNFDDRRITIEGIEDVKNETRTATGIVDPMPESLNVQLELGDNGKSSFGGTVNIRCEEPAPSPTPTPTPTPTVEPTPTPTQEVTPSPTPEVTPTPSPTPTTPSTPPPGNPPATPPSCPDTRPESPTLLSIEKSGSDGIQLIWSEPDANVEYYMISYGYESGEYNFGVANTGNTTTYRVGSLDLSKTYYFVVRSQKGCAVSEASNELRYPKNQQATVLADTSSDILMYAFQIMMTMGVGVSSWGIWKMRSV